MTDGGLEHVAGNVAAWQARRADQLVLARRQWSAEPSWGLYGVPESDVHLLGDDLHGVRALELGCGTGYVSAWLARRGASVVALDPTPGQLAIAASCQREFGPGFPLVRAVAEQLPLRDASVDFMISEYGAAIWADPYRWIPEAARVLRPGGELVLLGNSTLLMLCVPDTEDIAATDRLLRPQRGIHRFAWPNDPTVEFHLSHGDWVRLFRANALEVEDLVELYPLGDDERDYPFVTADWARQWPCEEVWRVRKAATA
ncbi:MAG: class I SAM-dependent methyltransferase [Actinomycetota bacterium]|nr:class I SAM-dependent methyltransferase [Actinomycetota bacterium]